MKTLCSFVVAVCATLNTNAQSIHEHSFALTAQQGVVQLDGYYNSSPQELKTANHEIVISGITDSCGHKVVNMDCHLVKPNYQRWRKKIDDYWAKQSRIVVRPDGAVEFNCPVKCAGTDYSKYVSGYQFLLPDTMYVGQQLEGGTVIMSRPPKNLLTKKVVHATVTTHNCVVAGEDEIDTPNGRVHCYKVTCHVSGIPIGPKNATIDRDETFWFARGLGLVGVKYDSPKTFMAVLHDFSGVQLK